MTQTAPQYLILAGEGDYGTWQHTGARTERGLLAVIGRIKSRGRWARGCRFVQMARAIHDMYARDECHYRDIITGDDYTVKLADVVN